MNKAIRWGILGTGRIARQFASALKTLPDAKLEAVGSRTADTALAFATQFNIPRSYPNYRDLTADPEIDAIYVATPHPMHRENAALSLRCGKAVLCEKPFTINAQEASQVIRLARSKRVFLMEGMWSRFFPLMAKLRDLVQSGAIGAPRMLTADFGFRAPFNQGDRLFDPALGGGALLDVGVYPVSLASMIFGSPSQIASQASLGPTGVDEQSAIVLRYPEGQLALLACAIRTDTCQEAMIMGTKGRIRIHSPWWTPTTMTIRYYDSHEETLKLPLEGNGYQYEAQEVMTCLRAGKHESEIMPLAETLAVMKTLDAIRGQWGLRYPNEKPLRRKKRAK